MITKQLTSYLFLLILLVVNVQRGISLKCRVCTTDDEKNDCWANPDKAPTVECGAETTTAPPEVETTVPPAGGTTAKPAGETTVTPAGETTAKPAGETTVPPAGETTVPPAGETTANPAGETTAKPAGDATAKPAGEATAKPAGEATAKPAGEATAKPAGDATAKLAGETPLNLKTKSAAVPDVPFNLEEQTLLTFFRSWKQNQTLSRLKRDTSSDWECVKIITQNKDTQKKTLQRLCAKKTEESCKDKKNDSDNKCATCSDKDLCNSASNIKLQLIPAFLSVFLALFISS
ncbi:transcriptional regulatory protein AlgP-like isoform X2 [Chelonus insularis]|uniref:transcriptional regulatory protein AlgP-like isoform X2 n=1 Tax=Chelonus insularis TaxID=460826 RepID=UPI00158CA4D1|nr:transcriptional regulatory protein AlgP-like isoform X2 [Chelonus insularis]